MTSPRAVEILPGVLMDRYGTVRVPVRDAVRLAEILSRACPSDVLDVLIALLLDAPSRPSDPTPPSEVWEDGAGEPPADVLDDAVGFDGLEDARW